MMLLDGILLPDQLIIPALTLAIDSNFLLGHLKPVNLEGNQS